MGQDSPAAPPARQRSDSDESTTQWLKSNFPLAGGALLALLTLALAMVFISVEERRLTAEQRLGVQAKLGQVQASIEAQLAKNIGLLHTLTAEVELSNSLENQQFSRLAMRLAEHNPQLASIVVAPDLIGRLEYNRATGKSYIGFNYRSSIEDYASIKKAIESQDVVIDGPSDFQHGQRLLTLRAPISSSSGTWGIVQLSIDYQHLLDQAGLFNALGELEVGISPADRPVSDESIIYGGVDSFGEGAVSSYVSLPQRQWLISAQPTGGWHIPFSSLQWHWLTAVCLAGMLGYLGHRALMSLQRRSDEIEAANYRAHYDVLTGLSNRYYFTRRLGEIIEQSRREESDFAVLFMDIDHFKQINDTLGHLVGDDLLSQFANRLQQASRNSDFAARLSGDEFVLILRNVEDVIQADLLAEKVKKILRQPMQLGGQQHFITVSMGIAMYPVDGEDVTTLLLHSDQAMYAAKRAGRNKHYFFNEGMREETEHHLEVHNDLLRGLQDGEFELHYQPLQTLGNNAISSVEALLRWRHPTKGLLYPDQFISIAERTGAIRELGNWVLSQACRDYRVLVDSEIEVKIAINRSVSEFYSNKAFELWKGILAENNVSGEQFIFEIPESLFMDRSSVRMSVVAAMRKMGVQFAIDDFGTGHTAISYLRNYPADILKIDKSFTQNMVDSDKDRVLVEVIAKLGTSLNLGVVGEGIETEPQRELLEQLGVQSWQGNLLAQPMPLGQLIPFLHLHMFEEELATGLQ